MSVQDYKDAIDILTSKNLNYEKIVIELVKQNPKLFLKIITPNRELFKVLAKDDWMTYVRALLEEGKKVEGIKLIRDKLGYGLKEAKDVADFAAFYMNPMLIVRPAATLSIEDDAIARQIAA